jgi:hypothetical protein
MTRSAGLLLLVLLLMHIEYGKRSGGWEAREGRLIRRDDANRDKNHDVERNLQFHSLPNFPSRDAIFAPKNCFVMSMAKMKMSRAILMRKPTSSIN